MYQQDYEPGCPYVGHAEASRPVSVNRRRRVRQKVHAPAYASFDGVSKSGMLDLYEVLDISEVGVAVQCASPMKIDREVELVSGSRRGRRTDYCDRPGSLVRLSWTRRSQPACLDQLGSAPSAGVAVPECNGWGRQRRVFGAADTFSLAVRRADTSPYSGAPRQLHRYAHCHLRYPERSGVPGRRPRRRSFPGCFPLPVSASGFWCGHCPCSKRARHHDLPGQRRPQRSARRRNLAGGFRFFRRVRANRKDVALR